MATSYSDILLTEDGDIDLTTNSIIFIDTNQLSLRQRLNLRFAIWQGEWKYNSLFGTPYRSYIGKPTTKSAMDSEIKRQIFKEPDVISINSFSSSLDRQARTYTCIAVVATREEDSLTYFLNLKDSFEYILPDQTATCKKIINYRYLTSKIYTVFDCNSTTPTINIDTGAITFIGENISSLDNTNSTIVIGVGYLDDVVVRDTYFDGLYSWNDERASFS